MSLTVDTKGAAELTGLAEGTLNNLRTAGTGPRYMKLGRAVRYTRQALEEWMAERTVSSTSQKIAA